MPIRSDESLDTILGGALSVVQPRDGYRFSVDSILLARFATARSRDRVLELGAGCGVISLVIAATARNHCTRNSAADGATGRAQ